MSVSVAEFLKRTEKYDEADISVRDNVPIVRSRLLLGLEGVKHGFSTRLGGVSEGIYADMSVGLLIGDKKEHVLKNYELLGNAIGIDWTRISSPHQVHETFIRRIDEEDAGSGIVKELRATSVDGQITDKKNVPLIVYGADCVPMLFADPVKGVIGTAHGGWRGTVGGIASKMIEAFQSDYGSDPSNIYLVIGPSAGKCCYEVDEGVAGEFIKLFGDDPEMITPVERKNGDDAPDDKKYMLSLWEANRKLAVAAGVKAEHISVLGICTICNADLFHSHRATGGKRGLNCGIISL